MTQLTIGAVLRKVKSLKGRMAALQARAAECVSHIKEKPPVFVFTDVEKELSETREELIRFGEILDRANVETEIDFRGKAMTLTAAIRRLQEIKGQIKWFASLSIREGEETTHENDYDEPTGRPIRRKIVTTYVSAVGIAERVKRIEALQKDFDELNDAVETTNMTTKVAA
ncbi:MAG: hypothetical protein Q7R83_02540 [bacterium]|nr:hypothetical protein [bacterium]